MNLFHLRYFVQLAHTQHYTRAAEQLCITQPSLSHAITQLEAELGVPLFEKSGRNTRLTRYGEEFLVCAENTLATLDAGVESLQRVAKGEGLIRLGLLRTLGEDLIPRLTSEFLACHPRSNIHFTFETGVTKDLLEGLTQGKYDLAFCSQPPEEMGLTAIPIAKQDLVLITPKNHPLAGRYSIDLRETLPYPMVYFAHGSGLRHIVDKLFQQIGETPQIAYETQEDRVIAGLVANGFGIAVVPFMELLMRLDVNIIQISAPTWERRFYMVRDDHTYNAPVVRQFHEYVMQHSTL